ncbi:MAG TPA: dihydrolipoamide acetyltransferase family protein [Nitrospiria bacterium]|nr:dihydrolipoamide acetyltransferase family protein [Nitrospiria bacterium]
MAEFVMPSLGADMSAGTLVAWRKKPGDSVKRGEIIAEVETEKAVIEVEVFNTGVIEKILVQPGQKVPVGTPMAIIRDEGKPLVASPEAKVPSISQPAAHRAATSPAPASPQRERIHLRISPLARKRAEELGIDPASVRGTGPGGAITREDIERASTGKPSVASPANAAAIRAARMRQTIAAAMARSKREIPHYYLSMTINMGRAMTWLSEENLKRPVTDRLLYGVLLIKAVALALREVPQLNALWIDGRGVQSSSIHVGVAVSLRQGGLVAPALHDADRQSVDELMRNFRDLVQRARAGSLRSSEISDPTITVTSLGEQGVETVYGIIYPPQTAIVGFGKMVERPWIADGKIIPRPLIIATLSGDHRVTDGHRGGLFLAAVDRLLQEPEHL